MSGESGTRDGGLIGGCCNAERGIVPVVYVTQCKKKLLVGERSVVGFGVLRHVASGEGRM
jgi:hypothetical protein